MIGILFISVKLVDSRQKKTNKEVTFLIIPMKMMDMIYKKESSIWKFKKLWNFENM